MYILQYELLMILLLISDSHNQVIKDNDISAIILTVFSIVTPFVIKLKGYSFKRSPSFDCARSLLVNIPALLESGFCNRACIPVIMTYVLPSWLMQRYYNHPVTTQSSGFGNLVVTCEMMVFRFPFQFLKNSTSACFQQLL